MANLRAVAKDDVRTLNLADWPLPVVLIAPDGTRYDTDATSGEVLQAVQILYDYRRFNPSTGIDELINEPVVVMHRDSLAVIPAPGERWFIKFPLDPDPTIPEAEWGSFVLSPTRAPEGGRSLGFIRFYPSKAVQL